MSIPGAKAEVFALLRGVYPAASGGARERFLGEMAPRAVTEEEEPDPEMREIWTRDRHYKWFNLLVWLKAASPDEIRVGSAIEGVLERFPEFKPKEHPELDHWAGKGGWVQPISPLQDEELLKSSVTDLLGLLESVSVTPRPEFLVDNERGLLDQIGRLAAAHLDWGFRVAAEVPREAPGAAEIHSAILRSWARHELGEEAVKRLLVWLPTQAWLPAHGGEVAEALEKALEHQAKGLSPVERSHALNLLERLWHEVPSYERAESPVDWFQEAINHPQGSLAYALLHLIGAWRAQEGGDQLQIPTDFKPLACAMLEGERDHYPLARVVLVSALSFLYANDEMFARDAVLPLLDWKVDTKIAAQSWNGFLHRGRIYPGLFEAVLPHLRAGFENLALFAGQRRRLTEFLASCAVLPQSRPIVSGWLQSYFAGATENERREWTAYIVSYIEDEDGSVVEEIWNEWLGAWFGERLTTGHPPVASGELEALYRLALSLNPELLATAARFLEQFASRPTSSHLILESLKDRAPDISPDLLLIFLQLVAEGAIQRLTATREQREVFSERLQGATDTARKQSLRASLTELNEGDLAEQLLGPAN